MAASDTSTVAYVFMRKYSDKEIADAATRDHPFSRMARKELGLTGEDFRYFIKVGNPGAVGGTFATTQGDATSSKGFQPATTPALKYGVITLDGPSMARAGSNGAKVELITNETDGVLDEMADHLAFDLLRAGNGIRGRRASASTNIITLSDAADVRNFKVNMPVGASSNADGSSPRTGDTTVAGLSRSAGTVTLTSAAAINTFSDNDYMFVPGDPGTCVQGIPALIPLTAPVAAESFRGIDRSIDEQRLAGVRLNNTSAPIEENIGTVATQIFDDGKKANVAFLSPSNMWAVARRRDAKVEIDGGGGSTDYGFEFIRVTTPGGVVRVYADPDMPSNIGLVGNMGSLVLKHVQPYVHIIRDDGKPSMRQTTADGIEVRARSMSQPIIYMPGDWGIFAI